MMAESLIYDGSLATRMNSPVGVQLTNGRTSARRPRPSRTSINQPDSSVFGAPNRLRQSTGCAKRLQMIAWVAERIPATRITHEDRCRQRVTVAEADAVGSPPNDRYGP